MEKFGYLVSLVGEAVYQHNSPQALIMDLKDLDKVRATVKKKLGVEFKDAPCVSSSHIQKFEPISNELDVELVVERIPIVG